MSKKCTEFCTQKCDGDHHAVFLSLVKVRNKETLGQFRQLLRAYLIHGFKLDRGVPDARPSFRYPLLHWAAVLGKLDALKMLLKPPFKVSPTLKTDSHETALHRLLNVMDKKIKPSRVLEIVELLKACLDCLDEEKNTPYHVCADALVNCSKYDLELWKQVFYKMIDSALDKEQLIATLNIANSEGETVLHLLSKRDEMIDLVEYLLCLGVDISVLNANGETAVEVAWRFSIPIYNFYRLIESTSIGESHGTTGRNRSFSNDNKHNVSCNSETRTTRASLGLSETKDYTKFFKEEAISENDNDSDDDDKKCSLKRKLTHMNASLIDRLTEISEKRGQLQRKPKLKAQRRTTRQRRRTVSSSTTSSCTSIQSGESNTSDDSCDNATYMRRKRKRYQIDSDSSSDDDDDADDDDAAGNKKTKPTQQCAKTQPGGEEEEDEDDHLTEESETDTQISTELTDDEDFSLDESLDEQEIFTKIEQTIENVKALYVNDVSGTEQGQNCSTGSTRSLSQCSDEENNEVTAKMVLQGINKLDFRDQLMDEKIKMLKKAIKSLTTTKC